jgi:glycerol-3-phosphate dehydrogenase subunit B
VSDVVVIGGGMAGVMAALSARRSGAAVTLVRRSLGATAMSSGAVDVAADPTAPPGDLESQRHDFLASAAHVGRVRPAHPYGVLRAELPRLTESLEFAREVLEGALVQPALGNALLPTPLGTVKPAALALKEQAGADLAALPRKVAVVQLSVNPTFDARLVAAGIMQWAKAIGRDVEAVTVPSTFFREIEDALRPVYELAQRLDAPGAAEAFAEDLARHLPPHVERVLLPPFLGRGRGGTVLEAISRKLGVPCTETLSVSPSVPGLRLQEALDDALARRQVRIVEEEVSASGAVLSAGREHLPQGAVVLATGKFIGGGISRDQHFREGVFGLPVYSGNRRVNDQYIGDLLVETLQAEQIAFRAGIRTDARLRPLNVEGQVVRDNLFAAGAVLSGYDPATDKTGLGVAIFTGFLAGEWAAAAPSS